MTVQTETNICNLALDMLNQVKILDIDDNTPIAKSCKLNYEQMRDEILESYFWDFAKKKQSLAALSTAPEFGWSQRYQIPADSLTVMSTNIDGKFNGCPIDFEVVGNEIHTNKGAPLPLTYISRVTTVPSFSALFVRALSAKLAWSLAKRITGSDQTAQLMQNTYIAAMEEAEQHDGFQGISETVTPQAISSIDARFI